MAEIARNRSRFPLRGRGYRAEQNRALLVGLGGAGLVAAAIAGKRFVPESIIRTSGHLPYVRRAVPVFSKRTRRLLRTLPAVTNPSKREASIFVGRRPILSEERRFLPVPGAKKLMGYESETGTVSGTPFFSTAAARARLKRRLEDRLMRGSLWNVLGKTGKRPIIPQDVAEGRASRVGLLLGLKTGGRSRLLHLLERGEETSRKKLIGAITRFRKRFTDPDLPKGAFRGPSPRKGRAAGKVWEMKKRVWKEKRGDLLAHRRELERVIPARGHAELRKKSGRAVDRLAQDIALARLRERHPSKVEKGVRKVFRPTEMFLRRANLKLSRKARQWARRKGL